MTLPEDDIKNVEIAPIPVPIPAETGILAPRYPRPVANARIVSPPVTATILPPTTAPPPISTYRLHEDDDDDYSSQDDSDSNEGDLTTMTLEENLKINIR